MGQSPLKSNLCAISGLSFSGEEDMPKYKPEPMKKDNQVLHPRNFSRNFGPRLVIREFLYVLFSFSTAFSVISE
jgi:hypothetical protein